MYVCICVCIINHNILRIRNVLKPETGGHRTLHLAAAQDALGGGASGAPPQASGRKSWRGRLHRLGVKLGE